jgi:hypothetical protein
VVAVLESRDGVDVLGVEVGRDFGVAGEDRQDIVEPLVGEVVVGVGLILGGAVVLASPSVLVSGRR